MTRHHVALAQGLYYLVTGLWPLVSMRSFQAITGPKRDHWLVRTVGLLAAVIGGVLLARGADRNGAPDPLLGVGSAAAFAATDIVHVAAGTISPIYLGDAVAEVVLIGAWATARPPAIEQDA